MLNISKFIDETRITDINLDESFQKQSSLRAYYGAIAAQQDAEAARAKMNVDVVEAQLDRKYREAAATEGRKVTEKALESAVKLDPEWAEAKKRYIDAQCMADIARTMVASLNDRRDMLIQLGADRRDESKGQARVMLAQQEADRLARIRDAASKVYQN